MVVQIKVNFRVREMSHSLQEERNKYNTMNGNDRTTSTLDIDSFHKCYNNNTYNDLIHAFSKGYQ
jgi:hypothetical protein